MSRADRRARKKLNARAAREERYSSWRAARRRRWAARVLVLILVVALLGGGAAALFGGDDEKAATTDTTLPTTPTTIPAESVAGKPCVPVSEPIPEGAPEVPVQEGPPPAELVIEDLKEGDGEAVPEGATVTVNYIGASCSTGVIFDDSYSRGEPATFPLSGVISGWTEGIPGMKVGGQRLLGIPSEQAYGPAGRPPDIMGDEALWFVVELVSFEGA